MVCNTTQSAFYKVIAEYNDSCIRHEKNRHENSGENYEKYREKIPRKKTEKSAKKDDNFFTENRCENCPKRFTKDCPKNRCSVCGNKTEDTDRSNRISDIFSDSDFLLICALIYILYKNGADQKIILALVFVLIS